MCGQRESFLFSFLFLFFLLASLGFLSPLSLYSSASIFSFVLALFFFSLGQQRQSIHSLYTALIRKDSMH